MTRLIIYNIGFAVFAMDRLFRIDFYPQEWLVETSKLSPAERGLFIQVVAMIYSNRGPIENDPAWIGRASFCSPRMARSLISILVKKNFLQESGGKLGQRRCERELNEKREHLESSSKGGRTSAEKRREYNGNNGLASSPTPTPNSNALHPGTSNGVVEGFLHASGLGKGLRFTPSLETAQRLLDVTPGWDQNFLVAQYNDWHNGKETPNNPDAAFLGWAKSFTKGRRPR